MESFFMLLVAVLVLLVIRLMMKGNDAERQVEDLALRLQKLENEVLHLETTRPVRYTPAPEPEETESFAASEPTTENIPPQTAETIAQLRNVPIIPPPVEVTPPPTPTPPRPIPVPPPIPVFQARRTPTPEPSIASVPPPPIPPVIPHLSLQPEAESKTESPEETVQPVKGSFEMRLGTYWLVRVGIVMVLTALAFFGNYAYHNFVPRLGPGGKVGLLYFASALLLGAGVWWQRKEEKPGLRNYAQVLFAGGLAAVYFTTYVAHHIPSLCIIESPMLDGVLLLAWAGFMAWIADRRKSEVLALFAVGLAYYTSVITDVGSFTLYSNLVLTLAAVVFLVRNRWAGLTLASLVATYTGYAYWRFFHGGEWHWTTPGEGLQLGSFFLIAYWVLFTASVFLSKHEKLVGANRAGYAALNNGAFFTLFMLTMIQVDSGGYWKFYLIYGIVLLALAMISLALFSDEKITKNAYLTQGLLLVTMGFIAKFAGLQLALVLGAEAVVLYVLGTQLGSLLLRIGAYVAGALAVGWGLYAIGRDDAHGLWLGSALGALLVFNAFWAHRQKPAENDSLRLVPGYFAALALVIWAWTTWQNTAEANFGLVLTIEALVLALSVYVLRVPEIAVLGQGYFFVAQCAWLFNVPDGVMRLTALALAANTFVFLRIGWRQKNQYLEAGGCLAALLAAAWGIYGLKRFDSEGLATGAGVAALMLLMAFLSHHRDAEANPATLRPAPTYFGALAILLVLCATWFNTEEVNCPLVLCAEALVLTASIYVLRVREVALLGQSLLLFGHGLWQYHLFVAGKPPWWNPVLVIGMTLALGHWWQKQKVIVTGERAPQLFQCALSLLFVLLACTWFGRNSPDASWLVISCLLAAGVTAYAALTRAWWLAACAQLFLLPGAWLFLQQLSHDGEPRFAALAPIAALGLLSFATVQWFRQKPDAAPQLQDPLLTLAVAYRWVALGMSLWWVLEYIPHREQIWTLMLIGIAVFTVAGWLRNREALMFGAAFSGLAVLLVWWRCFDPDLVYWANGLAILVLLGQQRIAQRLGDRYKLTPRDLDVIVVVGGLTLWLFVSRWVLRSSGGFYLTASWSGLALALFVCGMVLRERMYRWLGLLILAGALGHVVVFDVWKLETIYRILSFLALGIVLLILGFIYNKYQEKIREWL